MAAATSGLRRPTLTSTTTRSSGVSSSSRLRWTCKKADENMPLRRYRSFSMRCQRAGSSLHEEKTLRLEHFVRVMSVMTVPAWWVGR